MMQVHSCRLPVCQSAISRARCPWARPRLSRCPAQEPNYTSLVVVCSQALLNILLEHLQLLKASCRPLVALKIAVVVPPFRIRAGRYRELSSCHRNELRQPPCPQARTEMTCSKATI